MADYQLLNAAHSASYDAHKVARETNDPHIKKLAKALEELADAVEASAR